MQKQWPRTLDEAVRVHLLTMTQKEKDMVRNTPENDLIDFHLIWGLNIRNEFGLWEGNDDLIKSCRESDPDRACMAIIKAVWKTLQDD